MPIRRYVEHGVVFTPEALAIMSEAFTAAIETLAIGGDEIKRQAVAQFIIRLARGDGDLNAAALRDSAVAAFSDPINAASICKDGETSYQPGLEAGSAQPLA